KVGLNVMRNQSADASTRFLEGLFPYASGHNPYFNVQLRAMEYVQRSLNTAQLKGEHILEKSGIRIDWLGAYTQSTQDEPDLKYFNNIRHGAGPEYTYDAVSNNIRPASRYFRDMRESNMDLKANVEFPLANKHAKLKIGGSFVKKERAFNERIIQYKPEPYAKGYNGDIDDYFGDQNLGLVGEPGSVVYGLIIQDQTTGGGTYHGREI